MARRSVITIDDKSFEARDGTLLLDAALSSGVDLPSNCRAGYCGTCRVRVLSGRFRGGAGCEPGIVHACQSVVSGHAILERPRATDVRTVHGVVNSLRPLSSDVVEVAIATERALPFHAGQFAQLQFSGYPARPFSLTHPLRGRQASGTVCFQIRRMKGGHVTSSLGRRIKPGHRVDLAGPYGSAHFRPACSHRLVLVATSTGFAPIWAIAVAALRENPDRELFVIAGGATPDALYMAPALVKLARFPYVHVVAACSSPKLVSPSVRRGRPTDFMPPLLPTDEVYACGAPPMVEAVRSIAAASGVMCHSDPFMLNRRDDGADGMIARTLRWLTGSPRQGAGQRRTSRAAPSSPRPPTPSRAKSGPALARHEWS